MVAIYHQSVTLGGSTEHFTTSDGIKVMAYARDGQPFSVCMPKSTKSITKFFRVPTKVCEKILDIVHFLQQSLHEIR